MPPKSTTKKEEVLPTSRRSARLGTAPVPEVKGGKKRTAEEDVGASKKVKVDTTSKTAPAKSKKESTIKSNLEVEIKSRSKVTKDKPEVEKDDKADRGEKEEKVKPKPKSSTSKLQEGDKLPSIKLENEDGEEVDVSTLTGEKGVVIFVYPKADTPGCTNQACGFRDHLSEIKELGYEIYGLSKDKPAALKRWKIKKELNYSLLSDPESKLIKRLGAFIAPNNSCRSHFIFSKESGELVDIAIKVKPADDPKNCLAFIKNLHAQTSICMDWSGAGSESR